MTTINSKAARYSKMFECINLEPVTRYYGQPTTRIVLNKKSTNPLYKAVIAAHGDRLPNDWIYETFYSLLETIANHDIKKVVELQDKRGEIVETKLDTYTHEQLAWLASDTYNLVYLTQAIQSHSYSMDDGAWQIIQEAQRLAIDEVMDQVINLLTK